MHQSPSMAQLFGSFLRLGITAFGGPAMIPYVRKMTVAQKHWLDGDSFQDGVALCQVIPGATVMQMVAYVGLKMRGVTGALASFIGFGLPALLLMMLFSILYAHTRSLPAVVSAFSGLQAIIVAVVANATLSFGKTSLKNWKNAIIALIAAGLFGRKANPVLIVLLAAFLGMLLDRGQAVSIRAGRSDKNATHDGPLTALSSGCSYRICVTLHLPEATLPSRRSHVQNRFARIWRRFCFRSPHVS